MPEGDRTPPACARPISTTYPPWLLSLILISNFRFPPCCFLSLGLSVFERGGIAVASFFFTSIIHDFRVLVNEKFTIFVN